MRSSSVDGRRAVAGSPPDGRPYRSLTGRSAFSRAYRDGVRTRSGGLAVLVSPGVPGTPQVAVVAGRRVGTAVRRNRAKRRLRAALERVALQDGAAYVVIAGREAVDVDFGRLVQWLRAAIDDRPLVKEDVRE